MQGQLWPGTIQTAKLYSDFLEVDKVIVSCWKDDELNAMSHGPSPSCTSALSPTDKHILDNNRNIILLRNDAPDYVGPGHVNLQILSSRNGVKESTSDVVVKTRTDQRIYHSAFLKWNEFFSSHIKEEPMSFLGGDSPSGKIFVMGMNHAYPYHPQDHIYWGYREDIETFFDIPFSYAPPLPPEKNGKIDFSTNSPNLRNPIYLAMHYFSRFSEEAKKHTDNYAEYLQDLAPKFDEAMQHYSDIRSSIFRVLPRIDDCMWWEKFNSGYRYDLYYHCGERYE